MWPLTANAERFILWRAIDGGEVAPQGAPEMPELIDGIFERRRLLSLLQNYTVFEETPGGLAKLSPVPRSAHRDGVSLDQSDRQLQRDATVRNERGPGAH